MKKTPLSFSPLQPLGFGGKHGNYVVQHKLVPEAILGTMYQGLRLMDEGRSHIGQVVVAHPRRG